MIDAIKQIPTDLILKDYINYYLNEYIKSEAKTEINNKLLHLLLNSRFNENNEIIKNNIKEPIKVMLIKIIWIESNINYISNILKIFELAIKLFNDDGIKLYNIIEQKLSDENKEIKYIVSETRNPEHIREVNECFYILLVAICYSITSDELLLSESYSIKDKDRVEINLYCGILKEINKILQNLNEDLLLFLNEMYIIDELIKVIELQNLKKIDIEKIQKIRKHLSKSAEIIQNELPDKIGELKSNLDDIYRELLIPNEEIIKEKGNIYYDKYYDTFRYIYYKEMKKVYNDNYHSRILEYLLKEKEIIKKSNNIFQILFRQLIKVNKDFKKVRKNILESKSKIISYIESNIGDNQQKNYFSLTETLLYFFEKKSLNYFKNIFYPSKEEKEAPLMEKEPTEIFKECINFLQDLEEKKKYDKYNKYVTKLFCLGYIRIFCHIFINMFDAEESKFKEPEKIIKLINEKKTVNKMIRLYIYKILFNKYQLDGFLNKNNILKYKLEEYEDFKSFLKLTDDEQINYGFETLDNENYEKIYKILENKKKDKFKNKIKKDEIGDNLHIDNFYVAESNLILLHLKGEEFKNSEIYLKFYENISKPLYDKNKYSTLIQTLFNPKIYVDIKERYHLNSNYIEAILYGYRYCLNELLSDEINDDNDNNDKDYLYLILY